MLSGFAQRTAAQTTAAVPVSAPPDKDYWLFAASEGNDQPLFFGGAPAFVRTNGNPAADPPNGGGGLIINGETYHGIKNLGTEFGHVSIDVNGRKCGCGNSGCVEL
jgi:hypothetical protein